MIGIVIAMESEAEILLRDAEIIRTLTISGKSIYIGKAYGKEFALCQCGVGKVNAALGAQLLISKFDVKSLVNFGVAGGLNSGTKLCAVWIACGIPGHMFSHFTNAGIFSLAFQLHFCMS